MSQLAPYDSFSIFKRANEGHDTRIIQHYQGYKNIQHTVGYTALASDRFYSLWNE
jgi:type 1 fimbriae regulatory protein FimB